MRGRIDDPELVEACVERATGDILVVKKAGSPWSRAERDSEALKVVFIKDPYLLALLQSQPVVHFPYAIKHETAQGAVETIEQSEFKIDADKVEICAVVTPDDMAVTLEWFPEVTNG